MKRGIQGGIAVCFPGEAPEYRRPLAKVRSSDVTAPQGQTHAARLAERGLLEAVETIAAEHHVTIGEIMGRDRHAHIVAARHHAWLYFKAELGWSYPAIARFWGAFNHTTIMSAVDKAARLAVAT